MGDRAKLGGNILGLVFLAIGIMRFLQGESWVVWIILGVLFGGLAAAGTLLGKGDPS